MTTVANDLDLIQARLHDDGALWSRTELLRWMNWGLAELIDRSQCLRRIHLIDLPGRFAYTYCYEWEDRHTTGPAWMCLLPCLDTTRRGTYLWEAEQVEGVAASAAFNGLTQQWERAYQGDTDRYYEFGLPKLTDVIYRVAWNGKWLGPVSVREFDNVTDRWMRAMGEPRWWTPGTGRIKTLQVYEIQTAYIQNYEMQDYARSGMARFFSGTRTYAVDSAVTRNGWAYTTSGDAQGVTSISPIPFAGFGSRITRAATDTRRSFCTQVWEQQMQSGATAFSAGATVGTAWWEGSFGAALVMFGVGTIRGIVSPDRQYWGVQSGMDTYGLCGGVRDLRSSDNALQVWHSVSQEVDLVETDTPDLIPAPMQKYLRYFALAKAYGRPGEGQQLPLSLHYSQRFDRGVKVLKKLTNQANKDRVWRRQDDTGFRGRTPLVRLPSNFERTF